MGQQVAVVEKPSPRPGVMRFETNRSLTGMGHERFTSVLDAVGPRPAAVLARTLLSTGKVDSVYIYGNIVTVDIASGKTHEYAYQLTDGSGVSDIVAGDATHFLVDERDGGVPQNSRQTRLRSRPSSASRSPSSAAPRRFQATSSQVAS